MEQISSIVVRRAFPRAPHMSFGGAAVWFTSPPGGIFQLVEPVRGSLDLANWMVGPVYDELDRRFPGRNALIMVLDLELMTGRSIASRTIFLAKAREVGKRFSEGLFVPPRAASPAQRVATQASIALIRALGVHIELAGSSVSAVASRNLVPAL